MFCKHIMPGTVMGRHSFLRRLRPGFVVFFALRDEAIHTGFRLSMALRSFSLTCPAVDSSLGLPAIDGIQAVQTRFNRDHCHTLDRALLERRKNRSTRRSSACPISSLLVRAFTQDPVGIPRKILKRMYALSHLHKKTQSRTGIFVA